MYPFELDNKVDDACAILQKTNATYSFGVKSNLAIGGNPGVSLDVEFQQGDWPVVGTIVFLRTSNAFWQVILSSPKCWYGSVKNEHQRIISSLKFE